MLAVALVAVATLGACKKSPQIDAKNASPEEVQKQVAQSDIRPRAGRWQQSLRIEALDMPGMPPEMKAAMERATAMTHTGFTCLTPEQAAKPDASFFQQAAKNCTYDHFTMGGGQIDAKMTCTEGPQQQVSTMKGTYGSDNYDMKIEMDSNTMGKPVHTRLTLKMNRVGECTGKDEGK
jgi:hypothetical protein